MQRDLQERSSCLFPHSDVQSLKLWIKWVLIHLPWPFQNPRTTSFCVQVRTNCASTLADALQYVATHVFGDSVRGREERMKNFNTPLDKLYPERMKALSRAYV